MKIFITKLLLITSLISLFPGFVDANSENGFFVVTAYYSPLPNQTHYSYSVYTNRERTYAEEKRLQGEGIRGASGKKVFSGMLAAPKNYRFGTKIYLEGLGVGEVADRGGAIVNKGIRGHNYDRIDIWMGYGDEGLKRATYWGKRTIKGSLLTKDSKITLNYKKIPSPNWVITSKGYLKRNIDIFNKKLVSLVEYKRLQEVFVELGYYKGPINGDKKPIIDSIFNFQIDTKIIKSIYSRGAGSYGPITRKKLKSKYNSYLKSKKIKERELVKKNEEIKKEKEKKEKLVVKYKKLKNIAYKEANLKIKNIGSPKFGNISIGVRELQNSLKLLGYFDNKDTAIYGPLTRKSIIKYQIDKQIIKNANYYGAGIVGPKTRKALSNDLKEFYLNQKLVIHNIDKNELVEIINKI